MGEPTQEKEDIFRRFHQSGLRALCIIAGGKRFDINVFLLMYSTHPAGIYGLVLAAGHDLRGKINRLNLQEPRLLAEALRRPQPSRCNV